MSEVAPNKVNLCPNAFFDSLGCGSLGCTLTHEGLHTGGLPGNQTIPHPQDFACFAKCMGCKQ